LGTDGGTHNSPLPVFLSGFLGRDTAPSFKAQAIAYGGGPCSEDVSVMPMVVSSCAITNVGGDGSVRCGFVTLDMTTGRQLAFADLTPPSMTVTEAEIDQQFQDAFNRVAPQVDAFTPMAIDNGAGFGISTSNWLANYAATCPSGGSGCPTHTMPVVNIGTNCGGSLMPARVTPVGFVEAYVTSYTLTGAGVHTITFWIDCTRPSSFPAGGCADFGFQGTPQRAVKLVK